MKNQKQYKIAKEFNVLEKIKRFESELLKVNGVVEVEFDLYGFYDDINQVIFLTKYEVEENNYFNNRKELIKNVIEVANNNGLTRTEDSIEDYGRHFYFVTRFNKDWK